MQQFIYQVVFNMRNGEEIPWKLFYSREGADQYIQQFPKESMHKLGISSLSRWQRELNP